MQSVTASVSPVLLLTHAVARRWMFYHPATGSDVTWTRRQLTCGWYLSQSWKSQSLTALAAEVMAYQNCSAVAALHDCTQASTNQQRRCQLAHRLMGADLACCRATRSGRHGVPKRSTPAEQNCCLSRTDSAPGRRPAAAAHPHSESHSRPPARPHQRQVFCRCLVRSVELATSQRVLTLVAEHCPCPSTQRRPSAQWLSAGRLGST